MNAQMQASPLPLRLPPASGRPRRHRIGSLDLQGDALSRFNALLANLDPNAPSVGADQLATLARWLQAQPRDQAVALLSERLARAEMLRRMLHDTDWEIGDELRERARMLISYLHQVDDLIPDDKPLVGHLDDALLVELAWPAFADETLDYGDFCRFRADERPRGSAVERRLAWETACIAEVALRQQLRQVRRRHYAGGQPLQALFRVG